MSTKWRWQNTPTHAQHTHASCMYACASSVSFWVTAKCWTLFGKENTLATTLLTFMQIQPHTPTCTYMHPCAPMCTNMHQCAPTCTHVFLPPLRTVVWLPEISPVIRGHSWKLSNLHLSTCSPVHLLHLEIGKSAYFNFGDCMSHESLYCVALCHMSHSTGSTMSHESLYWQHYVTLVTLLCSTMSHKSLYCVALCHMSHSTV